MPDNGQNVKRGFRYSFRMGEECEVANTDFNFKKLSGFMSNRSTSIFKDLNVAKHLSLLHDKYVIVSVDKALTILLLCVNHIT
jgi:hypothetical protein